MPYKNLMTAGGRIVEQYNLRIIDEAHRLQDNNIVTK